MSIFKLLYRYSEYLLDKLHAYEERTNRYLGCFRRYIGEAGVALDVGSGSGVFSRALAHEDRLVVALDIDRDALKNIRGGTILKVCADAHHLPFRECSFDCVLAISLLEHLKNPERCIAEVYRVLRHGAFTVIQLPNLQYIFDPHTKWPLLCLLPESMQLRIFSMVGYSYINMKVTIKRVASALLKAGFKLRKVVKVYHLGVMKVLPSPPAYIMVAEK